MAFNVKNPFSDFGADSVDDSVITPRAPKKDVTGSNAGGDLTGENPSFGTGSLNDGVVKPRNVPNAGADSTSTPNRPVDIGAAPPSNKGDFSNVVTSGGGSFGQGGPALRADSDGDFDDD